LDSKRFKYYGLTLFRKAPVVGKYEVLKVAMPPQQIPDPFGKTLESIKLVNCRIIQRILE